MERIKNTLGYLRQFEGIKKGRIEKTLLKLYNCNGTVVNSYEFIINKVLQGYKAEIEENYSYYSAKLSGYTKPKTSYRISKDNTFNEITKTEYEFAKWIINNNLITLDKIREFELIESERVIHENKVQEEKIKQEQEKEIKEKEEQEKFNNWLENEWVKYSNIDNLKIAEAIYKDIIGEYIERSSKILLTLIDNFDNYRCKNKLIDWLHTGNKASRKLFYCITGIKLPQTNKDTKLLLLGLTKRDFKNKVEYTARKKTEHKEIDLIKFYKRTKDGVVVCEGEEIKNNYGLTLFLIKENNQYKIFEKSTGMCLITGTFNKQESLKLLKNKLNDNMLYKLKNEIKRVISAKGELKEVC